jgi:hypothetical protein
VDRAAHVQSKRVAGWATSTSPYRHLVADVQRGKFSKWKGVYLWHSSQRMALPLSLRELICSRRADAVFTCMSAQKGDLVNTEFVIGGARCGACGLAVSARLTEILKAQL